MAVNESVYGEVKSVCAAYGAKLVAVSKTKPVEDMLALYEQGQRDFGENYVQELTTKQVQLPEDIHWHFIGHLQSNKVKFIAGFVKLIHGVDSLSLLKEINRQAKKINRQIDCLLQVHIAREESKFGFDEIELGACLAEIAANPDAFSHVRVGGLMGMASFTEDLEQVRAEFRQLKLLFDQSGFISGEHTLSMGMSSDFRIALEEGSNLVRIGSLLFGARNKP